MSPRNKRFWLPLGRLAAFFAVVVVAGNLLLAALRPATVQGIDGRATGFYSRQKRRVEKSLRLFQRLILPARSQEPDVRLPASPGEEDPAFDLPMPLAVIVSCPANLEPFMMFSPPGHQGTRGCLQEDELRILAVSSSDLVGGLPTRRHGDEVHQEISRTSMKHLGVLVPWWFMIDPLHENSLEPDPVPGPRLRSLELPPLMGIARVEPLILEVWDRRLHPSWGSAAGESLLELPEALLDGTLGAAVDWVARWRIDPADEDEPLPVCARFLDVHRTHRAGGIFPEFLERWVEREQKYFARFVDSELFTAGFEDGTEDVDIGELRDDQRKILWDALRKTYFSKYRSLPEDRLKDDAFRFAEWSGVDYAVLPPLLAGYLWVRGLEKKFHAGPTTLTVTLEPLSRWNGRDEDLVAGLGVEWRLRDSPFALIVSAGMYEGDVEVDFVGIGTSVGLIRRALGMNREE